jgi:DNA topoisomerase II
MLEKMIESNEIQDIKEFHTENRVHFILEGVDTNLDEMEIIKKYRLESKIDTNNLVLFNSNGVIKRYNSPLEIISEF